MKLQLRQEFRNLRKRDLSVADYTRKIKEIYDSLASIDVNIEESEMVQVCLRGLASKFGAFRTAVLLRLIVDAPYRGELLPGPLGSTFDSLYGYRYQGIAMCEGLVQGSVVK